MRETKTFRTFLAEAKTEYDFSSTQINLPAALATRILEWGDEEVPDSDLFTDPNDPSFGREDEPHITILYGLHTADPKPVEKLLHGEKSFQVTLGKLSLFTTNDKFDVLKIDAEGKGLHYLYKLFSNNLKATETYPRYIPHVTIAYVKKGKANHFVGSKVFQGETFDADALVFSSKNGKKTTLAIGGK